MITRSLWEPVLPSVLFSDARNALDAILEDICSFKGELTPALASEFALLFGYMRQVENSEKWDQLAIQYLECSVEKTSAMRGGWVGLHGGLCGVGWIVEHLGHIIDGDTETSDIEDSDDSIAAIDNHLINLLESGGWHGPYDLIIGLVGFGAYFLERLPRRSSQLGLKLVLQELKERREESWGGTTWHTPPQEIPYHQLIYAPDGYYNLGVAHGVPGVIKLLSECVSLGIEEPGLEEILNDSIRWLFAREMPPHADSRFSSWFVPGSEPSSSRLGWCYGDLGIAAVLFGVGRQSGRKDLETEGKNLLLQCTKWPEDKQGMNDAPLCHGAIGVAHIFNRTYQLTQDERFRQSAGHWYQRALAFRRPGDGVGGFSSYTPDRTPSWTSDYSFLSGGVGVALALISAMYAVEPAWDRLLLLSDFVHSRNTVSVVHESNYPEPTCTS